MKKRKTEKQTFFDEQVDAQFYAVLLIQHWVLEENLCRYLTPFVEDLVPLSDASEVLIKNEKRRNYKMKLNELFMKFKLVMQVFVFLRLDGIAPFLCPKEH